MPLVGTITVVVPRYVVRCCAMDVSRIEGAVHRVEPLDRKGLGGIALRRIGRKPQPFPVEFTCDYPSLRAAHEDVVEIRSTLVGRMVNLWHWSGSKWSGVFCLDIQMLNVQGTPLVSGGLGVNSKAVAIFRATMLDASVYTEPQKGYTVG